MFNESLVVGCFILMEKSIYLGLDLAHLAQV